MHWPRFVAIAVKTLGNVTRCRRICISVAPIRPCVSARWFTFTPNKYVTYVGCETHPLPRLFQDANSAFTHAHCDGQTSSKLRILCFADEIKAHTEKVTCLDLGETGRVLVTGGQDRNVNLWAIGEEKCFMVIFCELNFHRNWVLTVAFACSSPLRATMGGSTACGSLTTTTLCTRPMTLGSFDAGTWTPRPFAQRSTGTWKAWRRWISTRRANMWCRGVTTQPSGKWTL